jgi:hypothetical protein
MNTTTFTVSTKPFFACNMLHATQYPCVFDAKKPLYRAVYDLPEVCPLVGKDQLGRLMTLRTGVPMSYNSPSAHRP